MQETPAEEETDPDDEDQAVDAEVLTEVEFKLADGAPKKAQKIAAETVVAELKLPADLKAGKDTCKITFTGDSIFKIKDLPNEGSSADQTVNIYLEANAELVAGDYDLTVEVEMLVEDADGKYTKGAHRKLPLKLSVVAPVVTVVSTPSVVVEKTDEYDAILTLPAPQSATDLPEATGFKVQGDAADLVMGADKDYTIEGLDIVTLTEGVLKAKDANSLGQEKIVTVKGTYIGEFKLKIVVPAYEKTGKATLVKGDGSKLDFFEPLTKTALTFKLTGGTDDYADYEIDTATFVSHKADGKEEKKELMKKDGDQYKYYKASDKSFTIPDTEMEVLADDITITVKMKKGTDTYDINATVAAVDPNAETQPNFEHANATYYYVPGSMANQELMIVDRVANMDLALYKGSEETPLVREGEANAVYSYDPATGKLVIYGKYLNDTLNASTDNFELTAKFTYGDFADTTVRSGSDTRKESKVKFVKATTAPVLTIVSANNSVDFTKDKVAKDVAYTVSNYGGFDNITKLEAHFYTPASGGGGDPTEIAKVEVPRERWTFDRNENKLTISKAWFDTLRSADYYKDITSSSKVKFDATFTALSTDGELTVSSPEATITKPSAGDIADFTFISGNGVIPYNAKDLSEGYYAILEVDSKLKTGSTTEYEAVPVPLDLEKAFDGANGTKLYAVPGLKVQLNNASDGNTDLKINNTILSTTTAATTTTKGGAIKVDVIASNYTTATIDVFVINKHSTEAQATKLTEADVKDLPEGVNIVNGNVTIKRTGSLASGSFDLAKMFKGVELPPFVQDKEEFDTFTVGVKYKNEILTGDETTLPDAKKTALEADKKKVSLSGTTVTAESTDTAVTFVVSFTDSKSGLVYGTQEVTVTPTVVGQSSDTIKTELYTGKQDSTAAEPADDATRLKAHAAAGLSFSGNTIHFNEEQLRLAIADPQSALTPLKNGDNAYAATLWVTTNAADGENVKVDYAISTTLKAAQEVASGDEYKKGIKYPVNFYEGNDATDTQTFYITWFIDKDTTKSDDAIEKSITEVTVSIDMDKTQSIVGTSAWEVFTPSNAAASYAESGLTVAGDQLVYNAQAATAQTKLSEITLIVKAPANTADAKIGDNYDSAYDLNITGVSYDKTLGALVAKITFPGDGVSNALGLLDGKYIRWTIETTGEDNAKTISYAYTKAVNPYSYSTINQAVYEDIALSEKSSTITLDGMKSLPKDALYAGAISEIKLATAVAYQGIDGKPTTLPATVTNKTMIDWSYDFVSSGKNETYAANNPKGVSVAFDNASTEAGKGQTMKVTVDQGITKGGTLTITGKFHNNSLIGSVEKKLVLKIAPLHYVEDVKFAVNSAQLTLAAGKSVTYAPKLVIEPSAKASYDKLELTVAGINGTEAKATVDDKNKVIFTAPGQYELTAKYLAKKLGGTAEELLASDTMVVTVVDKTNAYKSLALADPKGSKVVDVVKTNDVAAMTVDVPMLTGKDATGAVVNIDPKADEYKSAITYLVAPGKNSVAEINIVDGVITANVANGGATAKVTAFYMGKSVPFTVNFYTTDKDDKAVLALYDKTGAKIDNKNLPKAGEVYSYKLETSGKTPADIAYFESALEIVGDGKNLKAETYKLNTENKTIQFLAPVSGKLNFTLKGDPKNRKGSLAVNMTKTAEAPTSIYFDEKNIEAGAGALFDGSTFYRVGTDDATITINPVLTPSWAYDQFTWTVSDSKVATIKANKDGSATLTWKKINDDKPLLVTATTKSKNAKTSYTMSMWVSDSVPSIVGNPKTVFINTADSSVGTTLALDYGYTKFDDDSTFTAKVVTYDKKKGEYIEAPAYTADISADGKAVTLRASSTAKAGKYYLKLMGIVTAEGGKVTENGPYYLPLTVKLGKVTDPSKISVTGKVAAVNNAVYGNLSLITLTGKNVDPSAVLLEMSKDVDGLALVKVDGLWYIKYTGTPVADKTKTSPQTIELKYSIPGVALTNDKLSLKVTYKAALADYNFSTKTAKYYTLGKTNTTHFIDVEFINKSGVFKGLEEYPTISFSQGKGKGAYLADYMEPTNFYEEEGKFYLGLKTKSEKVNGETVHADLPSGNLTANITLTFKGGATATAPITITVNTDGSNKTVKVSKAVITGSMPIIAPGSDEEKELRERGAYLTLTLPATIEEKGISDVQITSPEGFVVEKFGNTFRVGYKGTLADYQAIKSKLTVEAAFDGYIKPEGSQVKATTIASIQIAKPAAAFDKAVPFTTQYKVVREGETHWISVGQNAAGEYALPDMKLGDPALELRLLNEQGHRISGLTFVSSAPEFVKTNSFTEGMLYAQGAGDAKITVSGTGYIPQTINVTVNADELALREPAKADGKNAYKITRDFDPDGNEIGITDLLPTGTTKADVTVLIDAKDQSIVSYDKTSGNFTIHKGTPGVTATIRKTNYADVKLTFVINEIDAEAQRVSNTGIVSGSVKEGFKLDGLKKGVTGEATQIMFTVPAPGTKYEIIPVSDKAAQYVTCEELKDGQTPNGKFQFTWKADATADVVYNIKADGYKAVTVTISAAKLSKRALLEAFKAKNDSVTQLEVYGENATLTLEKSGTVDLGLQITDTDAKNLTYVYSDTTGTVVEMKPKANSQANEFTFTAKETVTTSATEPTLTIKYPGYEDAAVKVKVVETKEQDGGVISLWNGEIEIQAATPYVLENLVVGATTGTDVTFRTTSAVSGPVTTALTVTPSGHDQEAVEVTVSDGKATFKAKKYVKDGALFTFKATTGEGTYKTGTIKVTTAEVGKLIKELPKDSNGFTVTGEAGSETAALALSVGNPVTIRFSDKIDITAKEVVYGSTSDSATSVLEVENQGGGYFKFTAHGLIDAGKDAITFKLSADGYTDATVTVTITSLESFLTETTDPSAEVKLAKASSAWTLTVPVDTFEHTSGEILEKNSESLPAGFNVVLAKTSTSELTGPVSDYADFSYQKEDGTIKIKPKKAVAEAGGLVLRLSATGYGDFDVKVVFEANPMTLTGDNSATDVQYDLNTPNEPKTIAVPFDADNAGSYTFTAKDSDGSAAITGLEVSPAAADSETGISAEYNDSNGTVTIAVVANTRRGTSQVITLKAKGYTPVEVTVSVQKEIVVTPPANSGDDWASATKTLTIAAGAGNYEFGVVGADNAAIEGIKVDKKTTTDTNNKFTGVLDTVTKKKVTVTASDQVAAEDTVTYTISAPGYETVEITLEVPTASAP